MSHNKFQALESLNGQHGWQVGTHESSHYHILASNLSETAAKLLALRLESVLGNDGENAALRERSGEVDVLGDRLTSFLYDLLRDHLPSGVVERMVREADADIQYTNGWLAEYARDLARRLR